MKKDYKMIYKNTGGVKLKIEDYEIYSRFTKNLKREGFSFATFLRAISKKSQNLELNLNENSILKFILDLIQ